METEDAQDRLLWLESDVMDFFIEIIRNLKFVVTRPMFNILFENNLNLKSTPTSSPIYITSFMLFVQGVHKEANKVPFLRSFQNSQ